MIYRVLSNFWFQVIALGTLIFSSSELIWHAGSGLKGIGAFIAEELTFYVLAPLIQGWLLVRPRLIYPATGPIYLVVLDLVSLCLSCSGLLILNLIFRRYGPVYAGIFLTLFLWFVLMPLFDLHILYA